MSSGCASPGSACTRSAGSTGSTATDMGVAAVRAGVADAGGRRPQRPGRVLRHRVRRRGRRPPGARRARPAPACPIVDVEAGCASGGAALQLGADAIAAGQYDRVLVFGIEKMPRGVIRSSFFGPGRRPPASTRRRPSSRSGPSACCARPGLTKDDLAAVVVKNRRPGVANPDAMFRSEVTVEQVLASRMVCDPLHLWMLCSPNEGAAAVVLRRAGDAPGGDRGARRCRSVRTSRATCWARTRRSAASTTPTSRRRRTLAARRRLRGGRHRPRRPRRGGVPGHRRRPRAAGLGRARACAGPASSARLLADGDVALGGRRPVNPSGGLLSKGEPLGASALGQVVELVRQLRGDAGDRQVERSPDRPGARHRPRRQRLRHDPRSLAPVRPPLAWCGAPSGALLVA